MKKRILAISAILILLGACSLFLLRSYPAQPEALEILSQENVSSESQQIVFYPEGEPIGGLIFYPGGNVEEAAYAPLMDQLAQRGVLCVLLRMPLNLAVFKMNGADGVIEGFPQVENWYLAGHSLGGAMAASYAAKHADAYRGLILMAAYSTGDLSASDLSVLSIYGTEDGVMNRDRYEKYRSNLPHATQELQITGGCHAYFGAYGPQSGDGTPTITPAEQWSMTADAIVQMILSED